MTEAMRLTVPLNALRAFEAAARHLSIKDAAGEIGVTPSAVSHQLRILEELLGVELMRRVGPRLELTETGKALAPELTAGFGRIVEAVGSLKKERKAGPLRLSMLPTFAVHWLSPRLTRYPFARAGFELLISTTQTAVDLNAGVADAAVRHGGGVWPGVVSERLFEETVGLLGRADWLRHGEAGLRAGIARTNLFLSQHRREDFARWNGTLPGGPVKPAAITIVDSAGLGLKAAIDGAGLTLAGLEIAGWDIAAGRLTPLLGHQVPGNGGYYLCYPPALDRDRRIRNLRAWMHAEVAKGAAPSA
ncbi:LysR substrate-binding domain-containing protein [Xanthobacter autotrophicus DSM 597]|uniref:LysR substrate-binding domain-containing protein n=1 Tax=Xanthobacter TaxID=279 RepID=UPI001AE71BE1|nr:LysR substrate-binding domain-containing protein [Xanthobacter flavus]MBP2150991.1 LysR family glycine cleavage system transcriptional activator [Xanthobacter flavus]